MTTMYPIDLTCTVCGADFGSNGIASCGFGSKRTDFRPNYWGFNPAEYFVHLCPKCGFCANEGLFNGKKKTFTEHFKDEIKFLGPLDEYSMGKKLERAAVCSEIMIMHDIVKDDNYATANTWIKPFWWTDSKSDIIKFGEKVLHYFEKALEENEIPSERCIENIYLMGEINRRIGNLEEAADLFDEVIAKSEDKKDLEYIRKLAIQQKLDPKDTL